MENPWEKIELFDYEKHMSHETVGQLQCLNSLMEGQLNRYPAESVIVLGIAGGNGLEHIKKEKLKKVYGIDINVGYLNECRTRYTDISDILECLCIDLTDKNAVIPEAEMIIADLLIEYIGYENFTNIVLRAKPKYVSCVVQVNEDSGFVSDSPYSHTFDGLSAVHCDIGREELSSAMEKIGYRLFYEINKSLITGKSLLLLDFMSVGLLRE